MIGEINKIITPITIDNPPKTPKYIVSETCSYTRTNCALIACAAAAAKNHNAISFIEREAAAYDEAAVKENQKKKAMQEQMKHMGGCPGSRIMTMNRDNEEEVLNKEQIITSKLTNWPVQIKLAPPQAPYFGGAKLLIRKLAL